MTQALNFLYDHKTDVLSISAGHPVNTDSVPLDEKVILHITPQTQEIVGFSIIDFLKRFTNTETPASIPIAATFERVNKRRQTSITKKITARRRAKK